MRGQGHWADGVPEETLTRAEAQQVLRRLFADAAALPRCDRVDDV